MLYDKLEVGIAVLHLFPRHELHCFLNHVSCPCFVVVSMLGLAGRII